MFFVSPAPVGPQHVWSESEDCLPFLQLAQDYISSCGKKTLHEILEKVFKSFRPVGAAWSPSVGHLDSRDGWERGKPGMTDFLLSTLGAGV